VDIVIANGMIKVQRSWEDKDSDFRGIQVYKKGIKPKGDPDIQFLAFKRIKMIDSET